MKHTSCEKGIITFNKNFYQKLLLMKKLSLLTVLFFCFSLNQSYAQFEGQIQIDSYEIESGEKQKDDDSFTMYITKDRILLQGDQGYKVGGQLETEGILVRHKEKDFVFLTGEKQAMQITKAGITSFMNMFGDDARGEVQNAESNLTIKRTGESQQVNGYSSEKFIITNTEKPEERSEVWMTKGVDINWGILAESWDSNMKGFSGGDFPLNLIFDEGYFPVKWEQFKNDTQISGADVEVTSTDVARSKVELPSDVKIVSLQDYLFQQMRKSQ